MTNPEIPQKFFWLDLETTGLEVEEGDRIWEMGALITHASYPYTEIDAYETLITHDGLRGMLMRSPFWSKRPQEVAEISAAAEARGKSEAEVEADLIELVEKHFDPNEYVFLAGNTIYFDKGFVKKWLPEFHSRLRYRVLDVSSFKLLWLANGQPEFRKQEKHRALDDIHESIEELKFYSKDIKFDGE